MLDSPQLDLESCLKIFPNVKYIGGSVGHRLDIHASCVKSRMIKISLSGQGVVALEQVVIFGRTHSKGALVDITKLPGCRTFQSSTRPAPTNATSDSEVLYGADNAVNGVIDGYNRSETKLDDRPFWGIELPEEYFIETIHITNFSAAGYAVRYSDFVIESTFNHETITIYKRSSPHVLRAKINKIFRCLTNFSKLTPVNTRQSKAQELLQISRTLLASNPNAMDSSSFSEQLLDCVEAFLPRSLEPGGRSYQLRDIPDVWRARITGINCETITPTITAEYYDPVAKDLSSTHIKSREIAFANPIYIISLSVTFDDDDAIYNANSFRIEILDRPCGTSRKLTAESGAEWNLTYDNAAVADLCKDMSWAAFLAGNESARCLGLIAKPIVMMRRSATELNEAYMWCRLNLHGKSTEVKTEVARLVDSATHFDTKTSRLRFGRHSFSTCLGDRNQAQYINAMLSVFGCLEKHSIPAMLLYGTLLGSIRSGTFIKHDDDVDVGYLSKASTHDQLMAEREQLMEIFKSSNFRVSATSIHLPFSVSLIDQQQPCWVELFPIWLDEDDPEHYRMYMHTMSVRSVSKKIIGTSSNLKFALLNGTPFPAPAQPEEFLKLRYGDSWQSPDPFFEI